MHNDGLDKENNVNKSPNKIKNNKLNESNDDDLNYETALEQVNNVLESNVQNKGLIKYQKAKISALEEELTSLIEKMKVLESEN